jgi:hypothetical protein
MAIENFYSDFDYKPPLAQNNWNTNGAWGEVQTFRGFIQSRSGNENTSYSSSNEKVSAILYTSIDVNLEYGGLINDKYKVISQDNENGISGVNHHKEILLGSRLG